MVDPRAIERLAAGRRTAVVSGTNGKTTTTALLARALGDAVAHNHTGANLHTGIAAAYADSASRVAAIEVDELTLPGILTMVRPRVVVLLNLSRDQLDRSHEVARVRERWAEALAESDAMVVANCVDPNVVAVAPSDRTVWFDPGTRWTEDALVCPRCGGLVSWDDAGWSCACGFTMPRPDYRVDGDAVTTAQGVRLALDLSLPGRINVGNASAALAAAVAMGVDPEEATRRMHHVGSVAGRYALYDIGGRPAQLLLAKNPAGMASALELVGGAQAIIGVNARTPDARDTSWLYDVPFEALAGRQVGATGERRADLALRLELAGAQPVVDADPHHLARRLPSGPLALLGTYTCFRDWRQEDAWRG